MDRPLDLKPEVTQGCGFESRLRKELHDCSPGAAQSAAHCSKCVHLDGLNAENTFHSSLYSVYCVCDNKAHPSLICIFLYLSLSDCSSTRIFKRTHTYRNIWTTANQRKVRPSLSLIGLDHDMSLTCLLLNSRERLSESRRLEKLGHTCDQIGRTLEP